MKQKFLFQYFYLSILIYIVGCANVGTPTGGPRDTKAPDIISENPKNKITNYNSNAFEITFDEFISLNNFAEQVMVTPSLTSKPQAKIKGKKIRITFDDTLAPNTTYTFYMGESIMDITEGNKIQDYKYVVSTGNYIDSLLIKGKVINSFDLSAMDKTWVMLYLKNPDSLIYNQIPYYITKTDANGNFSFSNLKKNDFYIAALKEENGNYIYDAPTEKIGFFKDLIIPENPDTLGNINNIIIKIFEENQKKQFLKKTLSGDYRKIRLLFNNPVNHFEVKEIKNPVFSNQILIEKGVNKDSITLWLPESDQDSIFLRISADSNYCDTLEIPLIKKTTKRRGGKTVQEELYFDCSINRDNSNLELNQSVQIQFSRPIKTIDKKQIKIFQNNKEVFPDFIFTDSLKRKIRIPLSIEEKQIIKIEILPDAFTDIFGLSNDTIQKEIKTRDLEYYGNLLTTFKMPSGSTQILLQLINEKGLIVSESVCRQDTLIHFKYLAPGTYKLKAIYDHNNNKLWDTGNFLKRIMPENVAFYKEPIIIRSNWDVEAEWILK